jgi:hypothetical protein
MVPNTNVSGRDHHERGPGLLSGNIRCKPLNQQSLRKSSALNNHEGSIPFTRSTDNQ